MYHLVLSPKAKKTEEPTKHSEMYKRGKETGWLSQANMMTEQQIVFWLNRSLNWRFNIMRYLANAEKKLKPFKSQKQLNHQSEYFSVNIYNICINTKINTKHKLTYYKHIILILTFESILQFVIDTWNNLYMNFYQTFFSLFCLWRYNFVMTSCQKKLEQSLTDNAIFCTEISEVRIYWRVYSFENVRSFENSFGKGYSKYQCLL